jgi:hypothetical protein
MSNKPETVKDHITGQEYVIEEITDTIVSVPDIKSTLSTSHIVMLTDKIEEFVNSTGQRTPLLIVARCALDDNEYACVLDSTTMKAYVVEVTRKNGQIADFINLDGEGRDPEWAVVSEFFNSNNVLEKNKIIKWIYNTRLNPRLTGGIPTHLAKKWKLI